MLTPGVTLRISWATLDIRLKQYLFLNCTYECINRLRLPRVWANEGQAMNCPHRIIFLLFQPPARIRWQGVVLLSSRRGFESKTIHPLTFGCTFRKPRWSKINPWSSTAACITVLSSFWNVKRQKLLFWKSYTLEGIFHPKNPVTGRRENRGWSGASNPRWRDMLPPFFLCACTPNTAIA